MAQAQPKTRQDPPVPRYLEDRVAADAELVSQVLEPDRTSDNVRHPDPVAPDRMSDAEPTSGADSIAEVQMSRRTDAGLRQPAGSAAAWGSVPWILGALVLFLVVAAFVLT